MDQQIDGLKGVSACLAAIDKTEPQLGAWVELDRNARPQNTHGPLAGIAVGIKDIIDVAGMACRYGSAIYCLLYTSPSPRDRQKSRMPSSA